MTESTNNNTLNIQGFDIFKMSNGQQFFVYERIIGGISEEYLIDISDEQIVAAQEGTLDMNDLI